MKRFIITESEKNNIREMYGMLKEQTIPKKPTIKTTKKLEGVTLSDGVTYRSPKIKNEQDLYNFILVSNSPLKEFVSNVVGTGRAFAYPVESKNLEISDEANNKLRGLMLYRSIGEFLRVHAITGKTVPMTLKQLQDTIAELSKIPNIAVHFKYSPSFLTLLFYSNSGISGDAKTIQSYYQNLLKQKLG